MAKSDYKRRKKTWRDVGDPNKRRAGRAEAEYREAVRKATEEQAQQKKVTPVTTTVPRSSTYNIGGRKITGGRQIRKPMSVEAQPFWETPDFQKKIREIQKFKGRGQRKTSGAKIQASNVRVREQTQTMPDSAVLKYDPNIKPGQRLYYDPDNNQVTNRAKEYTVSGGRADRPTSSLVKELLPMYTDAEGNLTLEKTGAAALMQGMLSEKDYIDSSKRQMEAAAQRGFAKIQTAISPLAAKGAGRGQDIEVWNAQAPAVPYGYTNDGEPFYFDERTTLQQAREMAADDPNTPWTQKALLWGVTTFYEPLKAIEMGSLAVKQFIESPAMQETFVGQTINAQLAAGRLFVHRAFKESVTRIKFEIQQGIGNLALKMQPERREIILNYLNDSAQRMAQVNLETMQLVQMNERLQKFITDPDSDPGIVTDIKTIREMMEDAPQWEERRNELYQAAFDARYDGDFSTAMVRIKEAVDADIKANPWSNPYQAYSFIQEPERYEAFVDDLAYLTVQKGSPLDYEQIKRLRQYHENFWVELSGEAIFDILNLPVVDKLLDVAVQGSKAALRNSLRGAGWVTSRTVGKIPVAPGHVMNDVFRYFARETTNTTATKISNNLNNVLVQMQRAAGSNENFKVTMRDLIIPTIQKADASPVSEMAAIFREAQEATGGEALRNVSLEQFKKLVDSYSSVSGKQSIIAAEKAGKPGMRLLTGEEWSKYLDEALDEYPREVAENWARRNTPDWNDLDPEEQARRIDSKLTEFMNTPKFSGGGISKFANDVGRAFVDYHRVTPDSRLLDDSLSGKIVLALRENAKKVVEIPGERSLATVLGKEGFVKGVETTLEIASIFRDMWTAAVLSLRPAWIVQNLTDSMFRSFVDGGSVWDDLGTLFFSTQAELAGEIGIVPTELGQSLSRNGLDFRDSVMSRLLYEGWKPNWGAFSYWNFERQRRRTVIKGAKDAAMRSMPDGIKGHMSRLSNWYSTDIATAISPRTIGGALQDLNTSIEFSLRLRMFNRSYFRTLRAIEPGIKATTLKEVPEHLKGIANQIWKMSNSNPAKINAYIDSLEGGAKKAGREYWAFNVPPGIEKSVIGLTAHDQENFLRSVRMQLDNLTDEILKTGRQPQPEDFQAFFRGLLGDYRLAVEERISESMRMTHLRNRIPVDKTQSEIPTPDYVTRVYKGEQVTEEVFGTGTLYSTSDEYVAALEDARKRQLASGEVRFKNPYIVEDIEKVRDLGRSVYDEVLDTTKSSRKATEAANDAIKKNLVEQGYDGIVVRKPDGVEDIVAFFPGKQFQSDVQMRSMVVQEATKDLRKPAKAIKGADFVESYRSAMRGVAEIEVVEGEAINTIVEQGAVRIRIGKKIVGDTKNLKPKLVDATMDALHAVDGDYLRRKNLFTNRADYAARFRMFMNQPIELMNLDSAQFRFFAQQMRDYPSARRTIESLRGRKMRFEELDKMWEKYVRHIPQEALWTREGALAWKKRADDLLDDIQAPPPEVREAGEALADSTIRVGEIAESGDSPVKGLQQLMGKQSIWRARLEEFLRNATPGPRRTTPGFKARQSLWDLYYSLIHRNVYEAESKLKNYIADLIDAGNIDEAQKVIDDWNTNFVDNFLDNAGIKYEIAADGTTLYSVTIETAGKQMKVMDAFSTNYFIAQFLSADVQALEAVPARLRRIVPTEYHESLYNAVYRLMGSTADEADVFTRIISDKADRWSQQTGRPVSEYLHRIGIKSDGFDEAVFNAYYRVELDEIGRGLPFGLGNSSADLGPETAVRSMSEDASRSFLNDFQYSSIYSKDSERYGRLIKEFIDEGGTVDYQKFTDEFLAWANEGKFGHQGKSKLFHEYREYLADIYRAVMDTDIETKLDPAINDFLGKLTRDADLVPKKEAQVASIRIVAKELGLPTASRDMLKIINEDVKEVADATFKETVAERSANLAGRLDALRGTEEYAAFIERPRTIADDYSEQGRFSPVVAEFIGQGARSPYAGKAWDDDFVQRLTIDISELPDSARLKVEESMMTVLEGGEGLRIVNLEGVEITDDVMDIFRLSDGSIAYTKEQVIERIGNSEAFVFKGGSVETPVLVFANPTTAGFDTLAHEMFHFFYDDLFYSPESGEVIYNIRRTMREETLRVLDTVVDDAKWIDELAELEESGELATLLRTRYDALRAKGYSDALFTTGTDADLIGQLRDEINIVRDAARIVTEDGPDGLESIIPYYIGNHVDLPVLSVYFNFPNTQHFKVALMDGLSIKYGAGHTYALDEELIAYTLNRWSEYSTDYSVYEPIFDKYMGKQASELFGSMYDINPDYARDALYRQAQRRARESGMAAPATKPTIGIGEEMQAAWEMWSGARGFQAFGKDTDRASVTSFRDWIRREMLKYGPDSEVYATLRHLMWETEQFESAVLRWHRGDELIDALTPVIPDGMIDDGMLTWMRNNEYSLKTLSAAERALKDWERFLVAKAKGNDPLLTRLTKEEMEAMRAWGSKATQAKAEMVDTIINGGRIDGRKVSGAIDEVNHVMLDYQTRNNFDQMMSNIIPFWMFPSRSWPFWIETMATHPWIIAMYYKVKRASESARYQAGAVNSRGEPLPSLEGYLPIQLPGMKEPAWVNPLAPFSFRYVLSPAEMVQDIRYDLQDSEQDMPPMTFMTKSVLEASTVFGFYPAPWITYGLKAWFDIPDYVLPQFPVLPQINLIPRWRIPDIIRMGNFSLKESVYPEASWHDYLVEREILREALQKMEGMTEGQKMAYLQEVETAIADKGDNPRWVYAYQQFTQESANKSQLAYFTGIYTKDFSDADADLYALRNELNMLKAALQNEVQMKLFYGETDQDYAMYQKYIDARNTPRGYLYQIYSDIGWITNADNKIEKDPEERAKLLATKIEQRRNNDMYYVALTEAIRVRDEALANLKIGAPWEQTSKIYDEFGRQVGIAQSQYDPTFEYYGTSKSAGRIADDVTTRWYDYIWTTRPRWNPVEYETYSEYESRVKQWERDLPELTKVLLRHFRTSDPYITKVMNNLRDTQQLPSGFFMELQQNTTADGMEQWRKQYKDDVFDALNKAWEEMYWNPYWDTVGELSGYARTEAEMGFLEKNPNPPNANELYAWIQEQYGDRFTLEEIKKWVDGNNDIMNYEERLTVSQTEAEKLKGDIWDALSWVQPGGVVRDQFEEQMVRNGVERDFLTKWYDDVWNENYEDVEHLKLIRKAILNAVMTLDLQSPTRVTVAEWAEAQSLNNDFTEIKKKDLPPIFNDEYNYYNELEYDEKKQYRKDYPDNYAMFEFYYNMRDAYGQSNPLWAKYYNPKIYEKLVSGGTVAPTQVDASRPQAGQVSSSIKWPPGMKTTISPLLVENIEEVMNGGRLTQYDVTYLEQLSALYPQWKPFIAQILARGE